LIIRPLVEADLRSIEALLGEEPDALFAAQYHPMHGPDRDGELWRRSRVAVSPDGNVVGAISVLRNPLHSGRFSVSIEVRPDHRRQGIGTALVEVARGLRPEPLPLSAKAHTTDLAAMALLQAVGGRVTSSVLDAVLIRPRRKSAPGRASRRYRAACGSTPSTA